MGINKLTLTAELVARIAQTDCWAVSEEDIRQLACRMVGRFRVPLLRCPQMRTIVAGRKFGSDANRFGDEFRQLAHQCAAIRTCADNPDVRAAAFFHLRFENIHPLTDCNGRVGRLILAEQIRRSFDLPLVQTLDAIQKCEPEYRTAFVAPELEQQFERMVRFVARIAGVSLPASTALPFSILPIFPEKNTKLLRPKSSASRRHGTPGTQRFQQKALAAQIKTAVSGPH